MKRASAIAATCLAFATGLLAADFDGDGVADDFAITRDAAGTLKKRGMIVVDPWKERGSASAPKGVGFIVRLSRTAKSYLLHDSDFLGTPAWKERKPPVDTVAKIDPRYRAWKKQVPALKGDAIQLGTEAGIDILLYWDGKRWRVFWPAEDP